MPESSATPSPALPRVTLYTDGGADPNPGPGGWGVVLLDEAGKRTKELHGGEPRATNNRMELTAAIRGLESLKQRCRVRVRTDSQYLRRGVTEWLKGWIARGWRRKEGVLMNEDLWRRLAELLTEHEITWEWVKGHAGERHNERADELATRAIREQQGRAGTAATAATSASGPMAAMPPAAGPVEAEIFLRVSASGGKGGWAALVRQGGEDRVLAQGESGKTPNQLDLLGALTALESLPPGTAIALHTGSDYLRNGATQWIAGWKRRAWKTQEGQPVQNRDLWQRLDAALAARRVHWPPVKGREVPEFETLGPAARKAAGRGK